MAKTINDAALVLLGGANIDESADKLHIWDADAAVDKHTTLAEIITRITALQGFFSRTPDYDSGEQTVAFNTKLTLTHGLGAIPRKVEAVLRNKTPEHGFAAGDEIVINMTDHTSADQGYTIARNATQVFIHQANNIGLTDSSFNRAVITVGSWRWVVRAWK